MVNTSAFLEAVERKLARQCVRPHRTTSGALVRCGSRLASKCPGCSSIHVGDWQAIIRSGVFNTATGCRFFLLTLTAPSFGAVHRVVHTGRKPKSCSCGLRHDPIHDSHLRGIPLDLARYGYAGQVEWNATSARLWDATRARLRLLMPGFEYAAVREWQARGAIHLHVLLRVPAAEAARLNIVEGKVPALEELARSVTTHADSGASVAWGSNVDCRVVRADESTGRAIWYLTKSVGYLVKDVADGGGSTSALGEHHWRLLDRAAKAYACSRCTTGGAPCRALLHRQWGATSHVVSVSRPARTSNRPGWSLTGLTRSSQHRARCDWASSNRSSSGGTSYKGALLASYDHYRQVAEMRRWLANEYLRSGSLSLLSVAASAGPPGHTG